MKLTDDVAKKYTCRYYTGLEKFKYHQADNESTTETAFKDLLHNISLDLNLTLIKTTEFAPNKNIIPDGIIKDDYFRIVGYWEAKDTKDDLDNEIYKKLKLGYPRSNIIFEDTQIAVLYQDNSEFKRYRLTNEVELTELLLQFFNYKEPVYEQFRQAIQKFKENISRLAEDFKNIIKKAKEADVNFRTATNEFLELCELSFHRNINESDVEDMLIQHLLTERIFRKVFDNPEFSTNNVIAIQLEKLVCILTKHSFNRAKFFEHTNQYYQAIEEEAGQFDDFTEKQQFLNKIYEAFFQSYSKKNANRNGIVYTPQNIVKFMVRFVENILQTEFSKNLSSKGVNIIDPCTGTGNFVMEIMRNIKPEELPYKYKNEIFANEIMLLPYYVASANIEHYYYNSTANYEPFENIVFTDSLDLIDDPRKKNVQQKFSFFFNEANSERAKKELVSNIFVIIGNPPYNASQESETENNKNTKNEIVDRRIADTYASESKAQLKNKLYDPYIKFFRWASDRLNQQNGVICFISNNSFMNDIQFDGMRKLLIKEFHRIYHFDLGGDVYLNPKLSGTKHNVFGIKVGVGITFLVRNSNYTDNNIYYHRLDEYLTREEKERIISDYKDRFENLTDLDWDKGYLDSSNNYTFDASNIQSAKEYDHFIELFNEEKDNHEHLFKTKYPGISTNRNEWVYNFTIDGLEKRMKKTIKFYNEEVFRLTNYIKSERIADINKIDLDNFVRYEDEKIKWSRDLKKRKLKSLKKADFNNNNIQTSLFRPFTKKHLYYDTIFIDSPSKFDLLSQTTNLFLCVNGLGAKKVSSILATCFPNLDLVEKTQVFPQFRVEEKQNKAKTETKIVVEENITDWALGFFRDKCKDDKINSDDIFYYVYAMFHHPSFLIRYEKFLQISSPRVPLITKDFHSISEIGKKLAKLHLNFEKVKETPLKPTKETIEFLKTKKCVDYCIKKMKISRDKNILTYNKDLEFIIPKKAWGYEVNGRTPLEWIVDQYKGYSTNTDNIIKLINRCITVTSGSKALIEALAKTKIS
jgi:predicted helicase